MTEPSNQALVTRLLDTAQLRVPNIPDWLRDDLVLAAETIIELRQRLDAKPQADHPAGLPDGWVMGP